MDSIPSQDYDIERFDHEFPEIDGALLMQFLDDTLNSSTDECENERLDFVIRSLEAEIGSDSGQVGDGESITGPNDDHDMYSDDGSGFEDINYDFHVDVTAVGGEELYVTYCEDDDHQDVPFGEQLGFYDLGASGVYNNYNYVGDHEHDHDHQYACVDQQVYSPLWQ